MTIHELHQIMTVNMDRVVFPATGTIPCPILADMIEDTTDIDPLPPEALEAIRASDIYRHVSTFYYTTKSEWDSEEWNTSYPDVRGYAWIGIAGINREWPTGFSFRVYKRKT